MSLVSRATIFIFYVELMRDDVKKSKRGACEQKAATVLPNRTAAA